MDSGKIERIAVGRVKDAIEFSDILVPFIDENDKTPIWDGNIFVYESPKIENGSYKGKIPVQVKGKKVDNFSDDTITFPFRITDLKSYLKDGGVIFFVVEIIDVRNIKIYYSALLPVDIKELLRRAKDKQRTISAELSYIDLSDTKRLESICHEFLYHKRLQYSTVDYCGKLEDINIVNFTVFSGHVPMDKYLFNKKVYLYGKKDEESIPVPINKSQIYSISYPKEKEIKVHSKVFFKKYSVTKLASEAYLSFGNNIKIYISESKGIKIKYDLEGSLKEQLQDISFLNAMVENNHFYIGKTKIDGIKGDLDDKARLNQYYSHLKEINNLMEALNIQKDLKMDTLADQDYFNLNMLIDSVLYNKDIKLNNIETQLSHISVGNIGILALITVDDDKRIKVHNIFDKNNITSWRILYIPYEGREFEGPIYLMLRSQDIIRADNLDLQVIEDSVKSMVLTDYNIGYVNLLILELIKAYDANKELYGCLTVALNLCRWLEEYDDGDKVFKINELQIIERMGGLNEEQIEEVMTIRNITDKTDFSILCGTSILVGNKTDFEYYFGKLSDNEREEFMQYPIYNLADKFVDTEE